MVSLAVPDCALVPESARNLRYEGVEFRHFDDLPTGLVEMHVIFPPIPNPAVQQYLKLIP